MLFNDRTDAGNQLADVLKLGNSQDSVVVALPRGGIPLGIIIAERYDVPFDVIMSKKIGHPFHSEYAIGAVSEKGEPLFNEFETGQIEQDWLSAEVGRIRKEMDRRREAYSEFIEKQSLKGKSVVIVDDGIATGLTMKAAVAAVREQEAGEIIVAVPVIPEDTCRELKKTVDQVVAVNIPAHFLGAVGAYYKFFPQVSDREVAKMLQSI